MKTVRIVTTQYESTQIVQTNAETWGELKREFNALPDPINTSEMTALVKTTGVSMELDSAVLPSGDFDLYLNPSKVKAG